MEYRIILWASLLVVMLGQVQVRMTATHPSQGSRKHSQRDLWRIHVRVNKINHLKK